MAVICEVRKFVKLCKLYLPPKLRKLALNRVLTQAMLQVDSHTAVGGDYYLAKRALKLYTQFF